VDTGVQRGGETDIARHHQYQPARSADACEVAAEGGAIWVIVVPEHDTGETAWQVSDGLSGIGQSFRISK
jgi:hypothetical protein